MKRVSLIQFLGLWAMTLSGSPDAFAFPCNAVPANVHTQQVSHADVDLQQIIDDVVPGLQAHNLKGFAITLHDRSSRELLNLRGGLARTQCDADGQINFYTSTETPLGSVSKLITTLAAIKAADANGIDLNASFIDYLPYQWRDEVHPRFQGVTLRQFLTHSAGFRKSTCGGRSVHDRLVDGDLFNCNAGGEPTAPPPAVGQRQYSNMLGIYSRLLAYMVAPAQMQVHEQNVMAQFGRFGEHWDPDIYDQDIETYAALIYNDYVHNALFSPLGISATCDMSDNAGGSYTLWYATGDDPSGEMMPDKSLDCASGAWILSSDEMARFLLHIRHRNTLLNRAQYALMESDLAGSHGWGRFDWPTGELYTHSGAWVSTKAWVASLPGGDVVTLVANTPPGGDHAAPKYLLADALEIAVSDGFSRQAVQLGQQVILP